MDLGLAVKHQTINLVKFKALSKRLQLPLCWTVGILEGLWVFACHNARDGDLSRFSDLELAGWLEYPGNETELIDALVETGWLDRNGDTVFVHDWNEHKPNWLKGIQQRNEKEKPSRKPSYAPSSEPSSSPSSEPSTEPPKTKPNLKPKTITPSQTLPEPEPLSAAWEEVVVECVKLGMDHPEVACEYAKNRGCLASEAMRQVEHFKSHLGAWGIGLLYKVIEHLRPEKRVQWPKPCAQYTKAKEAEKQKLEAAKATDSRKQQKIERRQNELRAKKLEAEFGPQLDAMTITEVRDILSKHFPMAVPLLKGLPCTGSVRKAMLIHLESVAKRPASCF
jgi:hypothetical protein